MHKNVYYFCLYHSAGLGYTVSRLILKNCIHFRYGEDVFHTILTDVDCSTENYLMILQCAYRTNPGYRCFHGNDVSVVCCKPSIAIASK